ncbi:MAG: hypothetical protein AAGI37_12555 [Planctomycetota bacterium]
MPLQVHQSNQTGNISRNAQTLGYGLLHRFGIAPVFDDLPDNQRGYAEQLFVDAECFGRYSMPDIARRALELENIPFRSTDVGEVCRSAVSTSTLSDAFTLAINTTVQRTFEELADTTQGWVHEIEVDNFKDISSIEPGKMGTLDPLPPGGHASHKILGVTDMAGGYRLARFAGQFMIDEMDMIDDRWDILQRIPIEMASAAQRLRPDLIYSIVLDNPDLADGDPLFHTNHANLDTAGSVMSEDSLGGGMSKVAAHEVDGVPLGVLATHLIVPPALRFKAKRFVHGSETAEGDDLLVRAEPRLQNGVVDPISKTKHAGSATGWYMASSPINATSIEVAYLRGTGKMPVIREYMLGPGQWGIGWDINLDIAARAVGHRGIYKATGEV